MKPMNQMLPTGLSKRLFRRLILTTTILPAALVASAFAGPVTWNGPVALDTSDPGADDVTVSASSTVSLTNNVPGPTFITENSIIFGAGVATPVKRGLMGWMEAGTSIRFRHRNDVALAVSDFRGGLSFSRSWKGPFRRSALETNDDAVFISRFQNDGIFYSQNRAGFKVLESEEATGPQAFLYWSFNLTADVLHQSWANFFESGPGVRFRWPGMPQGMHVNTTFVRGNYLLGGYPGNKPYFYDFRLGLWYAVSR